MFIEYHSLKLNLPQIPSFAKENGAICSVILFCIGLSWFLTWDIMVNKIAYFSFVSGKRNKLAF